MSKKSMNRLRAVLEELTLVDPDFPLQWALVFLDILENEGSSLKEVSERTGISMSVMSRTIGALSNNRRMGRPYKLLLVKLSKEDRRRKELYLSAKGRKLADSLISALKS